LIHADAISNKRVSELLEWSQLDLPWFTSLFNAKIHW
jgi:hypothetical protein